LRRILRRGDPGQKWLTFLCNHREVMVALDLFTVPMATFRVLYCFFVIEHGRRKVLHFKRHATSVPRLGRAALRETFAEAAPYRYAILDRDSIFNADVIDFLKATGLKPKRTSVHAPWQNGTAERWIEVAAAKSSTMSSR
jgi:putative transposase